MKPGIGTPEGVVIFSAISASIVPSWSWIPLRKAKTSSWDWVIRRTAVRRWYWTVSALPPVIIRSFRLVRATFCAGGVAGSGVRTCAFAEKEAEIATTRAEVAKNNADRLMALAIDAEGRIGVVTMVTSVFAEIPGTHRKARTHIE